MFGKNNTKIMAKKKEFTLEVPPSSVSKEEPILEKKRMSSVIGVEELYDSITNSVSEEEPTNWGKVTGNIVQEEPELPEPLNPYAKSPFKPSYIPSFSIGIDPLDDPDDSEEVESNYKRFRDRLKKLSIKYLESKNDFYLYKIIISNFSRHLNNAIMYSTKRPRADLVERIRKDLNNLLRDMAENDIINLDSNGLLVAKQFITDIYLDESQKKIVNLKLFSAQMCNNLINKAIQKGFFIDEEIGENIKSLDFEELLYKGGSLEICYAHPIKSIIYIDIPEGQFECFKNIGKIHTILNDMPTVIQKSSIVEETIEIDGKKFNKRIFESITESNYDNFISNLELETILDNKDIAEEDVVGGEFKLL